MPFDDLRQGQKTEWITTIEEMSVVMMKMADAIVKLRAEIAPLVERHQEEQQRQRNVLANQYTQDANQVHQVHIVICDCTPNRAQALSGFFNRLT